MGNREVQLRGSDDYELTRLDCRCRLSNGRQVRSDVFDPGSPHGQENEAKCELPQVLLMGDALVGGQEDLELPRGPAEELSVLDPAPPGAANGPYLEFGQFRL